MEYERKEWSMKDQLKRAIVLEGKLFWDKFYIPAGIFLCVLIVIGLIPKETCNYIRIHAMSVVAFVNVSLALGLICGLSFLPAAILAAPYGNQMYSTERTGDLSEKVLLAARVLLCIAVTAVLILAGVLASGLMEKFAAESMSWFHINFIYLNTQKLGQWMVFHMGFWKQIILTGLVQPLAFLWIFLRRLYSRQERQYVRSYILAVLLTEILRSVAEIQFFHLAPGKEWPVWIGEGVWLLVMLGSVRIFFHKVTSETK